MANSNQATIIKRSKPWSKGQDIFILTLRPEYADNIAQQHKLFANIEKKIAKVEAFDLSPKQAERMKQKMASYFADDMEDFKTALEGQKELLEATQCEEGKEEVVEGVLEGLQGIEKALDEFIKIGYEVPISEEIQKMEHYEFRRATWEYLYPLSSLPIRPIGGWPEWNKKERKEPEQPLRWNSPDNSPFYDEDDVRYYTPRLERALSNSEIGSDGGSEMTVVPAEAETGSYFELNIKERRREPSHMEGYGSAYADDDSLLGMNTGEEIEKDNTPSTPPFTAIYRPNRIFEPVNPSLYWWQWRNVKPHEEVHRRYFVVTDEEDDSELEEDYLDFTVGNSGSENNKEFKANDDDEYLSPLDIIAHGMREQVDMRIRQRQAEEREDDKWVEVCEIEATRTHRKVKLRPV